MKLKKKGFTLIELMIVLAVIAILAIVLVPRIGSSKKAARNTGVTQNMNAVRGYLENKIDGYAASDTFPGASDIMAALNTNFTGDDSITNPFSKVKDAATASSAASSAPGVYVTTSAVTLPDTKYEGCVIVLIDSSAKTFTLTGVDGDGAQISTCTVK